MLALLEPGVDGEKIGEAWEEVLGENNGAFFSVDCEVINQFKPGGLIPVSMGVDVDDGLDCSATAT
jgi:hypothetical protein